MLKQLFDPRGRPQSLPVVITIFIRSPRSKISQKQNIVQARRVIAIGVNVGLAEWIIDDFFFWHLEK